MKITHRLWLAVCSLLFTSATMLAQTTTVTGTKVYDGNNNLLVSGQWCMGASCFAVANGVIAGGSTVPNPTTGTITIISGATTYLTIPGITINAATFNWDQFILPINVTATGLAIPKLACAAGSLYTQNISPVLNYSCVSIFGATQWATTGSIPSVMPSGTYTSAGIPTFICSAACLYVQSDALSATSNLWAWSVLTNSWVHQPTGTGSTVSLPNAIVFGQGTSAARAAVATDVNALYQTHTTIPTVILSTAFNEGATNATLAGIAPSVGPVGKTWFFGDPSTTVWKFRAGGGIIAATPTASPFTDGALIDLGIASYTLSISFASIGDSSLIAVRYTDANNLVFVNMIGGGVQIFSEQAGVQTALTTVASFDATTAKVVLSGQSIIVSDAAGHAIGGTIPAGVNTSATVAGFSMYGGANGVVSNMLVTNGTHVVTSACAGAIEIDGCHTVTPIVNTMIAGSSTADALSLPEKGTINNGDGTASVSWDEDRTMGKFDCRDPKYGTGGCLGPNPGQALDDLKNDLICYEAITGKHPTITFPPASLTVGTPTHPVLVFPTGGNYQGASGVGTFGAGTAFQTTYTGFNTVQFNSGQTATCPNPSGPNCTAGVCTANLTNGTYRQFSQHGCADGGCINLPPIVLTAAAAASGGNTVYTAPAIGTFIGYTGRKITVTGFTNAVNNGSFVVISGTGTTITLKNAAGVAETHAASGADSGSFPYGGQNQNGFFFGDTQGSIDLIGTGGNGGDGLIVGGLDTHTFSLWSAHDKQWYTQAGGRVNPDGTAYNPATDGLHGGIVLGSLDGIFKGPNETYGNFGTLGTEYGHVAGIIWSGGDSELDDVFSQVEEIGVIRQGGNLGGRGYGWRVEGIAGYGIIGAGGLDSMLGLQVTSACLDAAAVTLDAHGICTHISDGGASDYYQGHVNNDPGAFPPSHGTGYLYAGGSAAVWDIPAPDLAIPYMQVFPGNPNGVGQAVRYQEPAEPGGGGTLLGPAPNITGVNHIQPFDTSPITWTGVTGALIMQDVWIMGGNANVTLESVANGGNFITCDGLNLNLFKAVEHHFIVTGGITFGPAQLSQQCDSAITLTATGFGLSNGAVLTKATTPASSTPAGGCAANSLWADNSFIYHCQSNGTTVTRTALASF